MKRRHQIRAGGPKAYWAAMRAFTRRGGFTTADLARRFPDRSRNTIVCYVHACARAGLLDVVGERPSDHSHGNPFNVYAVKVTAQSEAPFEKPDRKALLGAAYQQMWTAMRSMTRFTTRDLAVHASTDDVAVTTGTARVFCWRLEQAGYLQKLGRDGRWRVMRIRPGMNTGPAVPAVKDNGVVADRNPRAPRRNAAGAAS